MAAAAMMTSCIKTSDVAMITHAGGLIVTGEFNPELGLPVGYATLSAHDLATEVDFEGHNIALSSTGLITYSFDTAWTITSNLTPAKAGEENWRRLHGETSQDLFGVAGGILDSIDLAEIRMDFSCNIKPVLSEEASRLISAYSLRTTLESITVGGIDEDGNTFSLGTTTPHAPITNDMMQNGLDWDIFNQKNVVDLAQRGMRTLTVEVAYSVEAPDTTAVLTGEGLTADDDIQEWLLTHVDIKQVTASIDNHMDIPLKGHINNLRSTIDQPFNISEMTNPEDGSPAINFDVNEGYLVLEMVNALPLDADLRLVLDNDGQNALDLLEGAQRIPSAKMRRDGDAYYAADTSQITVMALLTPERMEAVRSANTLHIAYSLKTGTTMMPGESHDASTPVAIRHEDKMQANIYVVAKVDLDIDANTGSAKYVIVK